MRKFPHFFQSASAASLQTCLQIMCKYYGVFHSSDHLNNASVKGEDGAFNLRDTADLLGFRAKSIRTSLRAMQTVHEPRILELNKDHAVVLYKKGKNAFYVSDPQNGLIKYKEEMLAELSGGGKEILCWLFEPKPGFYSDNDRSQEKGFDLQYLSSYLKPYKKVLFQVLLGFLAGAVLSLFLPFMTQAIVDVGISTANVGFIKLILIAQIVLLLSQLAIEFIRSWALVGVSLKIIVTLISDFLFKLMKLPMSFFERHLIGDLRQRMEDNSRIQQFLTNRMLTMLLGIFIFLIYSIVMCIYSFKILLIFYIGNAAYVLWIFAFLKKRKVLDTRRFNESVRDQNKVYEMFTGIKDIKLNGWEDLKRWEWERIHIKLFHIHLQSTRLGQYQNIGAVTIAQSVNLIISFMTALSVIKGEVTLGAMFAIQFIIGQLSGPVNELIQFIGAAQDTRLSLDRIRAINNEPDELSEKPKVFELPKDHTIVVKDLSFGYPGSDPILKNINLRIPHGKVIAIVGESGSGKSTLIKILLRFFSIKEDEIRIGKVPLADLDINVWRRACGAVIPDGMVFSDTIINNIALNDPYTNNQQLQYAVHIANIKTFIEGLPNGYDTLVGQGGIALSQGQKQRLLIARAVYRNPAIIFLDEATNALDSNTERIVVERLNEFFYGRTVVVVAHRLSTVKHADEIIVLDKGCVVEVGDHKSLLEARGYYYSLVENQIEIMFST